MSKHYIHASTEEMTFDQAHHQEVKRALSEAEDAINEYDTTVSSPANPTGPRDRIYRECCSLQFGYYTFVQISGKIVDANLHHRVLKALQSAGETVPADDVELQRSIGGWVEDIAAIAMDLVGDEDNDIEE